MSSKPSKSESPGPAAIFATTRWSMVLRAGDSRGEEHACALEYLCRAYWYPLYAFARRQGHNVEDAQDLTQKFFARFLEKAYVKLADPARGRFRSFLLASFKNFLSSEWRDATRQKRGGDRLLIRLDANDAEGRYAQEPADESSPDKVYEKRWAVTLLAQVMDRLAAEFSANGRSQDFDQLKQFIWGQSGIPSQKEVAARINMTEGAVNVAVHRLRHRYRELLREEIAQTLVDPADVDDELRHLKSVLNG